MRALLHESLAAGGLGFSTSRAVHALRRRRRARPVAPCGTAKRCSRCARSCSEHPGTTLEFITDGCLNGFSDDEMDLMARMSATARRPLNWNVLTVDASDPGKTEHQLEASTRAEAVGGRVVALTMPTLVGMNMSFGSYCALFLFPGWKRDPRAADGRERSRSCATPRSAAEMDRSAHSPEAGVVRRLAGWKGYIIGDTYSPANEALRGKTVAEVAAERGTSAVRHTARRRDRRRSAHGAVAVADRRRRRLLEDPCRGLARRPRADRRLRRRRAPRPHVRRAVHDRVPRRLPPRPPAADARGRRAAHHERARGTVRAARPRASLRPGAHADIVRLRRGDGRVGAGPHGQRPAGEQLSPRRRTRWASSTSS